MSRAIYPGTFDPWHDGHQWVLDQAKKLFDDVLVVRLYNPEKKQEFELKNIPSQVTVASGKLLVDVVKQYKVDVVIRGLRGPDDFVVEQRQQYWSEDLGLKVPVIYLICPRNLVHVSSTAIKIVRSFRG